jgi:hypothetical protein
MGHPALAGCYLRIDRVLLPCRWRLRYHHDWRPVAGLIEPFLQVRQFHADLSDLHVLGLGILYLGLCIRGSYHQAGSGHGINSRIRDSLHSRMIFRYIHRFVGVGMPFLFDRRFNWLYLGLVGRPFLARLLYLGRSRCWLHWSWRLLRDFLLDLVVL